jgi:diaminopimelate epimerase
MRLTKHHGLGNDFLVALGVPGDAGLARALCERRTGVGADGLIGCTRHDGRLVMSVWNADGSRAEMSGNGIRCLAQALVDAGWAREGAFTITTDAGPRSVWVEPESAPGLRMVRVDMGPVGTRPDGLLDVGNPHEVVLLDDPGALAAATDPGRPDRNVELVVAGPGPDELTMRVFERGVGETRACGTGAVAAAVAAHRAGLVGPRVVVHQPGGDVVVEVKAETVVLTGPAQRIAVVEVAGP